MICLFVHQSAELYGSDRVLLALVDTLRRQSAYVPVVLLPEEGPLLDEFRRLGIEVHVLPLVKISRAIFTPKGLISLMWQLPRSVQAVSRVLAGRRVSVVHTNTLAVLTGAFWTWWHKVPHVWHVHEIINRPAVVAAGFPVLLDWFADRVVSISRMTQDNLQRRRPRLERKSDIVWNGLEVPALYAPAQRAQFRQELGISSEIVISLVGRINQWKGHRLLMQAAKIIAASYSPNQVKFLIAGSPPKGQEHFRDELVQDIQDLGLSDHVIMKEFVKDIWPVWAATDIAVVPSTEPEPFGMVAIEAMALEKPVVAAGHGGLLDIIEDSVSGIFFKPGDAQQLAAAIEGLLVSAEKRELMGKHARLRVQTTFSLGAQAQAFERIYDALVAKK